jgi:hypothetical protein
MQQQGMLARITTAIPALTPTIRLARTVMRPLTFTPMAPLIDI